MLSDNLFQTVLTVLQAEKKIKKKKLIPVFWKACFQSFLSLSGMVFSKS